MLYTQVRAFDAVARAGSFLAAAEVLGVSQPALSIQVRALEDAYEVKLFHRHGRTVRLTTAGKELLELSRRFMSLEGQIAETLSASKGLGRGRLKLAFDGPHITMPLLSRFHGLHPEIEVSVSMGNSRFVRQQLIERHVDLAVLPGVGEDSKIHAIAIKHHAPVVIVGPRHRWRNRVELDVHEIAREPMVARESGSNTQRLVDEGLRELGLTPRIVLRLGSREAAMEAVAAGLGNQHRMGDGGAGLDPSAIDPPNRLDHQEHRLSRLHEGRGRATRDQGLLLGPERGRPSGPNPSTERASVRRASGRMPRINEARCLGSGLRRLEPVADRELISAARQGNDGHQLAQHRLGHAEPARSPRVRLDAIIAAIGDADRKIEHLLR